jgi:hypothetical protein
VQVQSASNLRSEERFSITDNQMAQLQADIDHYISTYSRIPLLQTVSLTAGCYSSDESINIQTTTMLSSDRLNPSQLLPLKKPTTHVNSSCYWTEHTMARVDQVEPPTHDMPLATVGSDSTQRQA